MGICQSHSDWCAAERECICCDDTVTYIITASIVHTQDSRARSHTMWQSENSFDDDFHACDLSITRVRLIAHKFDGCRCHFDSFNRRGVVHSIAFLASPFYTGISVKMYWFWWKNCQAFMTQIPCIFVCWFGWAQPIRPENGNECQTKGKITSIQTKAEITEWKWEWALRVLQTQKDNNNNR